MKTVIEMARESWLDTYGLGKDHISFLEALERFAELARADEREACAKVADYYSMHDQDTPADIAEAIRLRGHDAA
jgi:hypothetical protein